MACSPQELKNLLHMPERPVQIMAVKSVSLQDSHTLLVIEHITKGNASAQCVPSADIGCFCAIAHVLKGQAFLQNEVRTGCAGNITNWPQTASCRFRC